VLAQGVAPEKKSIIKGLHIFILPIQLLRKKIHLINIMRNKIQLFLAAILFYTASFAQVQQVLEAIKPQKPFEGIPVLAKGSHVVQAGIGIPNNAATLLDFGGLATVLNGTNGNKKGIGPIFINYEYLINDNIGGIGFTHAAAKQTYNSSDLLGILGINASKVTGEIKLYQIAFTSTYHLYTTDKLDPYIKGGIGLNLWKGSYTDETGKQAKPFIAPTPVAYQGLVGLRYFVQPQFGLFGELSFSNLKFSANIGAAFKLN
jgi:opacity protein-like surface antigen